MGGKKAQGGSQLLGKELRARRGHRSLKEIERLTKAPPLTGRVVPLSASTLHNIERGVQLPSIPTLRTLSVVYNVPQSHLLTLVELDKYWAQKPTSDDLPALQKVAHDAIVDGDYEKGYVTALRCEELAQTPADRAAARGNKAVCLRRLGMVEEAAREFTSVLAEPRLEVEDRVRALQNLGEVYVALGNFFAAEMVAEKALELATRRNLQFQIAVLHNTLGNVKLDSYQVDESVGERLLREALHHYEKSQQIFDALGRPAEVACAKINIGAVHAVQGSFLLGFKYLREGLGEARSSGKGLYTAYGLKELGKAYLRGGNFDAARTHLLECERVAARLQHMELQFLAHFYLLEVERRQGKDGSYSFRRCLSLLSHLESRPPELHKFEEYLAARQAEGGMAS